ncbi:MAG: response regulator transcription factor [Anaerolineales bacterium]
MSVSILIIEDDPDLQEALSHALQEVGYHVEAVGDGLLAIASARKLKPALIVLDLLLSGLDGCEVYRILRKEITTPVLLLADCEDEIERCMTLERSADDYLIKPFSMPHFLARVQAYLPDVWAPSIETELRPPQPAVQDKDILNFGDLAINVKRGEVTLGGNLLHLKPKEYQLLYFLATHHGQTLSRKELLEHVWGLHNHDASRTVDVHVRWLRQKLEPEDEKPKRIVTVRGGGYRFEV